MTATHHLDITQATIGRLLHALSSTNLTSVDLVSRFLHRIGKYDHRGPLLNSICSLNPEVFEEAQASDDYRASGRTPRALEGIPFTIKDSFQAKGQIVAAASPAFEHLVASSDAAVVSLLRDAGAVLVGRTNMPPMADGGSQRGLFGRSDSPYNPEYLCTSFASGSSYGSGVATTASFAPIGLGGEAVSSGRAPASLNSLVGYSPSRGVIPSRGLWPLYPTCDVVAPHTKSVTDMLELLNVIISDDAQPAGDFWREQTTVTIPPSSAIRPHDMLTLRDPDSLNGKHIAVPKCYIGKKTSSGYSVVCTEATIRLWEQARADLEALGAIVTETDFPLVENYHRQLYPGQAANIPGIPSAWVDIERCQMIAMAWDDFLKYNNDANCSRLDGVDYEQINPGFAPMDNRKGHSEQQNIVRYSDMIEFIRNRYDTIYDLPGCAEALAALEKARKRDLEDWMEAGGFDLVVFPTNGDVGPANSEEKSESLAYTLQDGIKYSNGNRALKHLGVPALTVPMGMLADKKMPVGLTFAGKAWSDCDLLRYAYAYETASQSRESPPLTPRLATDVIDLVRGSLNGSSAPKLIVEQVDVERIPEEESQVRNVSLRGSVKVNDESLGVDGIWVYTNGELANPAILDGHGWKWSASLKRPDFKDQYPTPGRIARDQFMVVVIVHASNGRSAGQLIMVD
ncbi:Glutamyl-tRNA(Gln) amidotransferase subunit A 2 [Colletotrichum chlorophyti]|uniref:Glutamyl-tRNA(Gln) amidotransferase subunit A 2 n=1 Tax=Colletotrichum chlorophyti TaxID=708187 RepID=A0A1Q8RNW1_9PEZI|nr:Glutamyl-tRNA(Gln) amidotransferase subunit A 2 [Colletotrichum chlorophyti]